MSVPAIAKDSDNPATSIKSPLKLCCSALVTMIGRIGKTQGERVLNPPAIKLKNNVVISISVSLLYSRN